jgi:hypothetical protein
VTPAHGLGALAGFGTRITAVSRSGALLEFTVDGVWHTVRDGVTADLTGTVTDGTGHVLPATGTLAVRLLREPNVALELRFGRGRVAAAGEVVVARSRAGLAGLAHDVLGQLAHQLHALGSVTVTGRLEGGELEPEDVTVSVDLVRLLRSALRTVR